jgi:hypothetical protein
VATQRQNLCGNLGPVSMDGAGGMRVYNHQICGADTALVVQRGVAGVPLIVETSQVSVCRHYMMCVFSCQM